jgi:N-ethylmaleimide reductase
MSSPSHPSLLEPTELAGQSLSNRAVMAPMTRSRALGNVPNQLMAEYYGQRAGAGLIVTEGTSPTPNGLGYPRIPGIFSEEQVEGWRGVTDRVHEGGSRIFVQIMDTGRVAHPANLPDGADVRGPSSVALEETRMWVDGEGNLPIPAPRAMTEAEIETVIAAYVQAARNAMAAGFDGIELHGANGYLIEQFLNPHTNRRDDGWGGSMEGRARFLIEVAVRVSDAIGPERVGLRLSPYGTFNEMPHYPEIAETYDFIADAMSDLGLAYLHVIRPPEGNDVPSDAHVRIARRFTGTVIFAGDYDQASAERDLAGGDADLIAFARAFLANPDILDRFEAGAALNEPDPATFYAAGPEGYTDYPTLEAEVATR